MRENTELTDQIHHHRKEAQMSSLWQRVSQGRPSSLPSDWKLQTALANELTWQTH